MTTETKVRGFEVLKEFEELDAHLKKDNGVSLIPQRATNKSSGYDFRSAITTTINPGETKLIDTGITSYMQDDEELQLRCRSGLATKGLMLANGVGTVDADYYGKHIKFIYHNSGDKPFEIKVGDRIGQGIFSKYLLSDSDDPLSNERNGGFGSTGLK